MGLAVSRERMRDNRIARVLAQNQFFYIIGMAPSTKNEVARYVETISLAIQAIKSMGTITKSLAQLFVWLYAFLAARFCQY